MKKQKGVPKTNASTDNPINIYEMKRSVEVERLELRKLKIRSDEINKQELNSNK